MSQRTESALFDEQEDHVDLRPLARVAAWGLAAAIAVGLTVIAARSEVGERRMAAAVGSGSGPADRWQLVIAQLVARTDDAESEARRLAAAMSALSAEREMLAARVATLERNIGDLTGAIAARSGAAPQAPAAKDAPANGKADSETPPAGAVQTFAAIPKDPAAAAAAPAGPSQTPAAAPSAPQSQASQSVPQGAVRSPAAPPSAPQVQPAQPREHAGAIPAAALSPPTDPSAMAKASEPADPQSGSSDEVPLPRPSPLTGPTPPAAITPAVPERSGSVPERNGNGSGHSAAPREASKPPSPRTPLGIDVGGATTLGGLRALWAKLKAIQPPFLDELRPIVAVRDGVKPGSIQLRLVAGPVANAEAATRLCAALIEAGVPCHTAAFDGQRLALR
jgi:hypothetical protein